MVLWFRAIVIFNILTPFTSQSFELLYQYLMAVNVISFCAVSSVCSGFQGEESYPQMIAKKLSLFY